MSGIIGSKINIRGSGRIAKLGTDGQVLTSAGAGVATNYEDVAGGISWQAIETGSTMTAVAGEGYWVDTTSNACTITLPASASVGDTIIFADYDRTWGTNGIVIDSNGLNYQSDDDTFDVEYGTDGMALSITYMDATQGWVPTFDEAVTEAPSKGNQNGIFAYGYAAGIQNMSNLVSNTGVVGTDVTGVGTARYGLGACEYGGDKGIIAYGNDEAPHFASMSNLVSNTGVVATDTSGVGTVRYKTAACSYGADLGIFGFGAAITPILNMTNLVSNTGVVGTDVTGVGTARYSLGACEYGGDKGIFAYGSTPNTAISNLISNTGVCSADVTGVGTARGGPAACDYGYDKGIMAYGTVGATRVSMSNLVSNAGVVATDVTGVGTGRVVPNATQYGGDKGIFAYGGSPSVVNVSNLVTNAGVIGTDVTGVGTAREDLAACSYN